MKGIAIIFLMGCVFAVKAQSSYRIGNFNRVVVSPHINLVLQKGSDSSVKIEAARVDPDLIVVDVSNDVLSIYLQGARYHENNDRYDYVNGRWKNDSYQDAEVTAYVTFEDLYSLQVRGDQFVRCMDTLDQRSLKIAFYGEVRGLFASLQLREFRLSMFGGNELEVLSGHSRNQYIRCYGDNEVLFKDFEGDEIKVALFGDNALELFANDEIKLTSFGDSEVVFWGDAFVSRGIIIGDTEIDRLKIN